MSPRSPENLVNVSAIAFLLDTKTYVEPMGEYILVKKLENGVMILLMDTPSPQLTQKITTKITLVILRDSIWQVTLRSSVTRFLYFTVHSWCK